MLFEMAYIAFSHIGVSIMVADNLFPFGHQNIHNPYDAGRLVPVRSIPE